MQLRCVEVRLFIYKKNKQGKISEVCTVVNFILKD